jgi:hypothetical protein
MTGIGKNECQEANRLACATDQFFSLLLLEFVESWLH